MTFFLQQRVRVIQPGGWRGFVGIVEKLTAYRSGAWIRFDQWPEMEGRVYGDPADPRHCWMMFFDYECEVPAGV